MSRREVAVPTDRLWSGLDPHAELLILAGRNRARVRESPHSLGSEEEFVFGKNLDVCVFDLRNGPKTNHFGV